MRLDETFQRCENYRLQLTSHKQELQDKYMQQYKSWGLFSVVPLRFQVELQKYSQFDAKDLQTVTSGNTIIFQILLIHNNWRCGWLVYEMPRERSQAVVTLAPKAAPVQSSFCISSLNFEH